MRRWKTELGQFSVEALRFASALGGRSPSSNRLFVLGAPGGEPWHFVAHLDEQATRYGRTDLVPTLLRWTVPTGAPAHLAVSVDTMARASQHDTFLVISPFDDPPELLERVSDAKANGARIMSLHRGQRELVDLSHETLSVDRSKADRTFGITQHVVTDSAPVTATSKASRWGRCIRIR